LFAADNKVTHIFVTFCHLLPLFVTFCAPQNKVYLFFIRGNRSLTGINPDMMRQVFDENILSDATHRYVTLILKRAMLI
jgi:hypothetical protein